MRSRGIAGVKELYHRMEGSERKIFDPLQSLVENTMHTLSAAKKNEAMGSIINLKDLPGFKDLIVPAKPGAADAIRYKNGGKIEHYVLDPDIRRAVEDSDADALGVLGKILSVPANILRAGTVLQPAFTLANVFRDNMQAGVTSRTGMVPFEPVIRGLITRLGNPEAYKDWQRSGGSNSLEAGYFHDQAQLKRLVSGELKTLKDRTVIATGSVMDWFQVLAKHSEELTRLGEFQKTRAKGIKSGLSPKDASAQGAFESRDYLDFAMGGTQTRRFKGPAAFFGSQLAGTLREARAFKETPVKTIAKGLAYITAPTLALYAINRNDENYWDQPQWLRDTTWLLPIGKGADGKTRFFPLPKPPGLIGYGFTVPFERAFQHFDQKDKKALDGLFKGFASTAIPNPTPSVVRTGVEHVTNFSFFRRQPIEGQGLQRLPVDMRIDETTSLAAQKIAQGLKAMGFPVSPKKLDYDMRASLGTLGRYGINKAVDPLISMKTGQKAPNTNDSIFKRFSAGDSSDRNSETINRFYDKLTTLRQEKEREKAGRESEMDTSELKGMEKTAERLTKLRTRIKEAETQEEKDQWYAEMEQWALEYAEMPEASYN
jgi:hypothetical protein